MIEKLLKQQRENCYEALGNLPPNLKNAYKKKVMGASVPHYIEPEPEVVEKEVIVEVEKGSNFLLAAGMLLLGLVGGALGFHFFSSML